MKYNIDNDGDYGYQDNYFSLSWYHIFLFPLALIYFYYLEKRVEKWSFFQKSKQKKK